MRAKASVLLASAAVLVAAAFPARPAPAAGNGGQVAQCVRWRTEARYAAGGYNHMVILQNACDAPAVCTVTTNVNPDPISATLAPGAVTEVLTFRGSPASTFEARVQCALEARTRGPG